MTSPNLQGRVAIVSGASSGIGQGIAIALAKAGAAVAVNYYGGPAGADATLAQIEKDGGRGIAVPADISVPEQVQELFRRTIEAFGRTDILVANAGIQRDAPFTELSLDDWRRVIDVNLTGHFMCAQAAVRQFRSQPPPADAPSIGKVIFINSVHQVIPWAGHVNYAASKGGLKLLMETMAQELAHEKIRVNAIAPGAIKTAINREAWQTEEAIADLLTKIPYERVGEAEDVAKAAVWLASDESDYVVGATLFVDGGMTLYPDFGHGG